MIDPMKDTGQKSELRDYAQGYGGGVGMPRNGGKFVVG